MTKKRFAVLLCSVAVLMGFAIVETADLLRAVYS